MKIERGLQTVRNGAISFQHYSLTFDIHRVNKSFVITLIGS